VTTGAISVRSLLLEARKRLGPGPATALEAEVLLGSLLEVDRGWLFANGERPVSPAEVLGYRKLVERRASGEPIAYLTGVREFWSLPLQITPDVLIPRPETELLVEVALDFVPADAAWRIADLGTGSGAVAIAIAVERPACEVHATESSTAALAVAALNVDTLAPGRVALYRGSWLDPLDGRFRLVVSNPPYVAEGDPHLGEGDCRFEPRAALTPGPDGLAAIRQIASESLPRLEPGGLLAFEHGFDQGEAARVLLRGLGYVNVSTRKDLEGRERVTSGQSRDASRPERR
jgi:release factor glutamine methyltransferase